MWQWFPDDSFPIVMVNFPPHHVDHVEADRFIDGLEERAKRGAFALVINLVDASPQTASTRRYFFEKMAEFLRAESSNSLSAQAFVVIDSIMRGALTAYHWFTSSAVHFPIENFTEIEPAIAWCADQLTKDE